MTSGTVPSYPRLRAAVREHEILRVSAQLAGEDSNAAMAIARKEVLRWAQNRTIGTLPEEAWRHDSFDHMSGGRDCSAVRLVDGIEDIWAIRVEDPDKTVAGRIWTSEIAVFRELERAKFSLRLIVGSPEARLNVEPHVPGVVLQLIEAPGLMAGNFNRLPKKPVTLRTERDANLLIEALLNPDRKLPIVVLSVPTGAASEYQSTFDAKELSRACAGLALVTVLPARLSWNLTYRLGKRLSVYEGAARVYLPGFTQDANPFGGHELVFPTQMGNNADGQERLLWIAATGSVRRLELGKDVLAFAQIKLRSLEKRQRDLVQSGAGKPEQLTSALEQLALLQEQLKEALQYQQRFSDLHGEAEERAETAEAQVRAYGFRIQQLLAELKKAGAAPDSSTRLPDSWGGLIDWCDEELAGRVSLTPQARDQIRKAVFEDVSQAARCLLWLGNGLRAAKLDGAGGTLNDLPIEAGVKNAHSGNDEFDMEWQGKTYHVDWHIKNGGNTREPRRCLRIYYFWDDASQQAVIASMPAHRRTDAS